MTAKSTRNRRTPRPSSTLVRSRVRASRVRTSAHGDPTQGVTDAEHPAIANTLAVIDEIAEARGEGAGLNDPMDLMLRRIDWDLVPVHAIKSALTTILTSAPESESLCVNEAALEERAELHRYLEEKRGMDAQAARASVANAVPRSDPRTPAVRTTPIETSPETAAEVDVDADDVSELEDNTETLVALMRVMRRDDPEMYRALKALVSPEADRRRHDTTGATTSPRGRGEIARTKRSAKLAARRAERLAKIDAAVTSLEAAGAEFDLGVVMEILWWLPNYEHFRSTEWRARAIRALVPLIDDARHLGDIATVAAYHQKKVAAESSS